MLSSKIRTVLWIFLAAGGAGFLLYPSLSKQIRRRQSDREAARYEMLSSAENIPEGAVRYNEVLKESRSPKTALEEVGIPYESLLGKAGDPIGTLEIRKISLKLPIFAGSSEEVLDRGVGHIEWSSLPIGGKGTHTVLSGHRGLPSARLFSDLDELEIGDRFRIRVGSSILEYETEDIQVVLPNELESLQIEDDRDLCTLVTCTPYGVNTHRLLVRGHRVPLSETDEGAFRPNTMDPLITASLTALAVLALTFGVMICVTKKKRGAARSPREKEF